MKRYFIRFECTAGTLAVEKAMHKYIRETYADCVVSEDRIKTIKTDIEREMEQYMMLHKAARPVMVSVHNGIDDNIMHITIGQMSMTLIKIKREE